MEYNCVKSDNFHNIIDDTVLRKFNLKLRLILNNSMITYLCRSCRIWLLRDEKKSQS